MTKKDRAFVKGCAELGTTVPRSAASEEDAMRWGRAQAAAAQKVCAEAFGKERVVLSTSACTGLSDCAPGHTCCPHDDINVVGSLCLPGAGCPERGGPGERCHEGQRCALEGTECHYGACRKVGVKADCAGKACGPEQACFVEDSGITVERDPQVLCLPTKERPGSDDAHHSRVVRCTERGHCPDGERCFQLVGSFCSSPDILLLDIHRQLCRVDTECVCGPGQRAACRRSNAATLRACLCESPATSCDGQADGAACPAGHCVAGACLDDAACKAHCQKMVDENVDCDVQPPEFCAAAKAGNLEACLATLCHPEP